MLEARGLPVSGEVRERIEGCTDLATLEGWLRRVLTVASADELFDGSS